MEFKQDPKPDNTVFKMFRILFKIILHMNNQENWMGKYNQSVDTNVEII